MLLEVMAFVDCGVNLDPRHTILVAEKLKENFSEFLGQTIDEIGRKCARAQFVGALAKVRGVSALPRILPLIDKDLLESFDPNIMTQGGMVPLCIKDDRLNIAVADTMNQIGIDYCRQIYPNLMLQIFITNSSEISSVVEKLIKGTEIDTDKIEVDETDDANERLKGFDLTKDSGTEIGEVVRNIFLEAVQTGASDIHFKVENNNVFYYKLRIDGDCTPKKVLNYKLCSQIDSYIMVTAGLPLDARIAPVSGRFTIFLQERKIDARYERHPTEGKYHITVRLLDKSKMELTLGRGALVFHPLVTRELMKALRSDAGMIMVSGPTGSGKSSTVTAMLKELNRDKYNILTLENPVEEVIPGITHVQIDNSDVKVFNKYMASFMRSDPDIIFLGEVRDEASAKAALAASTTGHQVISTIHAARGSMILSRLINLGLERFDIAENLKACCSQRLVRTLCQSCCEERIPTEEEIVYGNLPEHLHTKKLKWANPEGCSSCNGGYKGRQALFEILPINLELSSILAQRNVPSLEFETFVSEKMKLPLMRDMALDLIEQGKTDLDATQDVVSLTD